MCSDLLFWLLILAPLFLNETVPPAQRLCPPPGTDENIPRNSFPVEPPSFWAKQCLGPVTTLITLKMIVALAYRISF